MDFYTFSEETTNRLRLVGHQQNGTFNSFLIWTDCWTPIPMMFDTDSGIQTSPHFSEGQNWLFDVSTSHRIDLEVLEEIGEETSKDNFPGSEIPRFSDEIDEYIRSQPTDLDRAVFIYGLAASRLEWEQSRSIEHLEAIGALSSFIGTSGPDGEDFSDWLQLLYPLTVLTDSWVLNPEMQFTVVDMMNWGFQKNLFVAFNDVLGILQAARVCKDSIPSSSWAVVSTFLLGALSERSAPEVFEGLANDLENTLNLMEAPPEMRSIVEAHWEQQIYPGH